MCVGSVNQLSHLTLKEKGRWGGDRECVLNELTMSIFRNSFGDTVAVALDSLQLSSDTRALQGDAHK